MTRRPRNLLFIVAMLLFGTAGTRAGQTCAQVGFAGIGPGCRDSSSPFSNCADCVTGYCMQYAAGDEDCMMDCQIGGWHWCS